MGYLSRLTLLLFVAVYSSPVFAFSSSRNFHHHNFHSGNRVIQLIIQGYADKLLRELQSNSFTQFSKGQIQLFRQRMTELYDHIRHHPALHQRHLWVGKEKPSIDPDTNNYGIEENHNRRLDRTKVFESEEVRYVQKRNRPLMFPSEEICKTNRQWEQINKTQDFYDNEVEVVQDDVQQYVFSYRCKDEGKACEGISASYYSECTERYGWMYMYYRRLDDPDQVPQWGYVAAPHHCACKITQITHLSQLVQMPVPEL